MVFVSMANCVKISIMKGNFSKILAQRGLVSWTLLLDSLLTSFGNLLVGDDKNKNLLHYMEGKFVNSIIRQVLQLQSPLAIAVSNAGQVFIRKTLCSYFE